MSARSVLFLTENLVFLLPIFVEPTGKRVNLPSFETRNSKDGLSKVGRFNLSIIREKKERNSKVQQFNLKDLLLRTNYLKLIQNTERRKLYVTATSQRQRGVTAERMLVEVTQKEKQIYR